MRFSLSIYPLNKQCIGNNGNRWAGFPFKFVLWWDLDQLICDWAAHNSNETLVIGMILLSSADFLVVSRRHFTMNDSSRIRMYLLNCTIRNHWFRLFFCPKKNSWIGLNFVGISSFREQSMWPASLKHACKEKRHCLLVNMASPVPPANTWVKYGQFTLTDLKFGWILSPRHCRSLLEWLRNCCPLFSVCGTWRMAHFD